MRNLGVPLVVVDPTGSPAVDTPAVGAANWAPASRPPSIRCRWATAGSA
ncbi:hypothetical protein ACFWBB_32710 [Streptomyces sp. NPDC060000]